ncbi:hypothetical protein DFH07DRAFT_1067489 [Mycena maculata]|uniref:Mitochondrial outer membrane protein IML2 n=1 Tax=Mycena maculata TaxID=230809 RepID=A0AAD7HJC8_9AGAR|nr:hypothetical protein DFH07DRAFT_1067489 [Mycena maculata]
MASAAQPLASTPLPTSSSPAATTTSSDVTAVDTSPTVLALASANAGFDALFANRIADARAAFNSGSSANGGEQSPFHLLGLGVCAFLEAALGLESGLMPEAARLLTLSEAGARRAAAEAKKSRSNAGRGGYGVIGLNGRDDGGGRFAAGLEWEILGADAVVLLGLTHALSESYMGYFQCMYALNAAHSKFTKLFKTVFPNGLPDSSTTASTTNLAVPATGNGNLGTLSASAAASTSTLASIATPTSKGSTPPPAKSSLFGRWGASAVWGKGAAPSSTASSPGPTPKYLRSSASTLSLASATTEGGVDRELIGRVDKMALERKPEGSVEEMVVAGTAFGFGLFNLVFSLLPKKVQALVGLLGFKHDRALALRALALSAGVSPDGSGAATGRDVHGVFAGLVLMTFHGVVLLMAGYQADEARTLRVYGDIVDSIAARYPTGALWLLNRAKIRRMAGDAGGAIAVLQRALAADSEARGFVQADTLLVFELAWTLLAQRRHQEAADAFVRLTELNSWYVRFISCFVSPCPTSRIYFTHSAASHSHFKCHLRTQFRTSALTPRRSHATYYFIAAGCYVSLGNRAKAQELLDAVPDLLSRKKMGGKDLPTEVLIRKKVEFYKEKQKRRGGDPARYVESIYISTADELGIFWNTFQRIDDDVAEAHIKELAALTPPVVLAVPSPFLPPVAENASSQAVPDLDTPDEHALRLLLLGILHRTLRLFAPARALLEAARTAPLKLSTWIAGVAAFELAVLALKEAQAALEPAGAQLEGVQVALSPAGKATWGRALKEADALLDGALAFAGRSDVDLASRLDSRVALLRDEIAAKRAMVGA